MQLITLNEALQWKGNCVARLCTLGGRHFCFAQPNIIGLAVWWGWCEKIDLSRAPPASHCVDKRRLLTGVTGVMAPPWHIKKWNQIQEGQRARTVSWPAFASNFCIWQSLPLLKTGMGWPVVTSSLRSALLGPISVWLTQIILLSWPVWIRQVFTSLPFPFTDTSVSITSILSYWALRKGRRALWGLSIWWKEAGCSLPQLAGGLQCPEEWLAAPLGPPEPRWGVLEPGVPRIQPKTLCHSELIVMCSRKKKKCPNFSALVHPSHCVRCRMKGPEFWGFLRKSEIQRLVLPLSFWSLMKPFHISLKNCRAEHRGCGSWAS